jgi:hypothetical protein
MDREATQSLAIASMLAALLVVPSLADNMLQATPMPPQPSAASTPSATPPSSDLLQPVQAGNVRYMTGGIGEEEREAMSAVKNDYNLHIVNSAVNGQYTGDTEIVILDNQGQKLASATAGPLFYVALPAGTYTVEATVGGETKKQKVTVGTGKFSSLYFRW